jgi:adenylate kinase
LAYIKEALLRPLALRVIVYGPPASGCTTLARQLAKKLNAVRVHAPSAVENAIKQATKLGLRAKELRAAGEEIPTTLATQCLAERLQADDCKRKGWVLHGFPRTKAEALALQMEGLLCTHFLQLDAPDEVLMQRYPGKRVNPETGDVYHEASVAGTGCWTRCGKITDSP